MLESDIQFFSRGTVDAANPEAMFPELRDKDFNVWNDVCLGVTESYTHCAR